MGGKRSEIVGRISVKDNALKKTKQGKQTSGRGAAYRG